MTGRVKWFNGQKGFGFIEVEGSMGQRPPCKTTIEYHRMRLMSRGLKIGKMS